MALDMPVAMLEANDDGVLQLPTEALGGIKPHAKFELEMVGDVFVLRPADKSPPFWQRATKEEWIKAFLEWAETPRPPTPEISLESLRRENMYD
jgi:hypothetical protein